MSSVRSVNKAIRTDLRGELRRIGTAPMDNFFGDYELFA